MIDLTPLHLCLWSLCSSAESTHFNFPEGKLARRIWYKFAKLLSLCVIFVQSDGITNSTREKFKVKMWSFFVVGRCFYVQCFHCPNKQQCQIKHFTESEKLGCTVAENKKGMNRTAVPETSMTREQLRSKIRQSNSRLVSHWRRTSMTERVCCEKEAKMWSATDTISCFT